MDDEEKERKFRELLGSGKGLAMLPFLLLGMFTTKDELDRIFSDIKKKVEEGKEKPDERIKYASGFYFEE